MFSFKKAGYYINKKIYFQPSNKEDSPMGKEADFELYFKPDCPYCLKVLNFFKDNNIIKFTSYNTEDGNCGEENAKKLKEVGGKVQVPCIVIDGKAMYESDDIIEYAKANLL